MFVETMLTKPAVRPDAQEEGGQSGAAVWPGKQTLTFLESFKRVRHTLALLGQISAD